VPRKLGQHLLVRKSILDRIADAACGFGAPLVIEIGPGKGALTEPLLERARKVVAIEVDPFFVHYLRRKFGEQIDGEKLEVIEGDVLKTNMGGWGRAVIAGNLPYYITSPILDRVFGLGELWSRAVFLVQAEVAARLAAEPGSRDFGFLSVQTQVFSEPKILFPVPAAAFRPPPKVESAVVLLEPRHFPIADRAAFLKFASACFRQKRKTLRNNLIDAYGKERVDAIEGIGRRAEQLSVAELAGLFQKLQGLVA
jgi:16S rRNA (adenine1518-N6/adenine1519-N6)-dimethyltransferase